MEKLEPSGTIGGYKYYTLNDLQAMYHHAKSMRDSVYEMKMSMLDIAELTQRYAAILADYESRCIDDCR